MKRLSCSESLFISNASVTISRVLYWTVIYPGRASPRGSSDRGGRGGPPACLHCILHRVGFTSPACYQAAGELLPRLSILTAPKDGGFFLLHFPWSRLRRPLTGTLALRCPDFPHARRPATVCSPRTRKGYLFHLFLSMHRREKTLTETLRSDIMHTCQRKRKCSSERSAKHSGKPSCGHAPVAQLDRATAF